MSSASSQDDFEIRIIGEQEWNPEDANVDVEVRLSSGTLLGATFFTIKNIRTLFARNKASGECAGGVYLWAVDMIIVKSLSRETIRETVADLIRTGEIEQAMSRLR